jgi:hypothetical protein
MLALRQKVVIALSAVGAALGILLLALLASKPVPQVSMSPLATQFDGTSAIEYTRALAEGFPDRVTGSVGARRAGEYLRAEFRKLGYQVDSPTFSMWLHGERVQGENIVARLEGESPETVAVIAHYDGQTTSQQAAEDNASGVGVLLELARVLRQRPHHRGLILVATDAEEWGMIGAGQLVRFFKSQKTMAVISVDYLNAGPGPALEITCSGQFGGYTPLWLRELMVAAGKAQGARVNQPAGLWEWVERALLVSFQDQGPLLRAGIPALNIATLTKDLEASRARYHSPEDVFGGFDPASFTMLGATVERGVTALDNLRLPASGGMNDFRLPSERYFPGYIVWLMQLLGLLPLGLAGVFAARSLYAEKPAAAGWRFLGSASWVVPLCLAALVLYGLTTVNVLKRYELYPATPKDPFLYELPLQVVVPLLLVLLGGFVGVYRMRARLNLAPESFPVEKRILYLWVSCVALAAFVINSYAMWFFLGGFAYATLLLLSPRGSLVRALNALLLLAALLPFLGLLYFFGREIFLGWRILWYLVLQAAYGVWSPFAVALFLLAIVLWVRLFWISALRHT